MAYDSQNIFAKILRGEIPCNKIHETGHSLAFHDINPRSNVHALVIPKGEYVSFADFSTHAPAEEIVGFFRDVAEVARMLGVEEGGYRLLANHGEDGNQEVPHFHVHIFGGQNLGEMIPFMRDNK